MNMEIAGHEFFSADGRTIWYDLQTPRGEDFWLAGYTLATGQRTWYHLQRDEWSVHFNVSADGTLFAGDGGDEEMVAHAKDGKWIYLYRTEGIPDVAGIKAPNAKDLIKPGFFKAERLVNMAKHDYRLEPNATFTPDQKKLVYCSHPAYARFGALFDLAGQKQRTAGDNQSVRRRDARSFCQRFADAAGAKHVQIETGDFFRNRGRFSGAQVSDLCQDGSPRGGKKYLRHLHNRFVSHRAENDRDRGRAEMLVEKIPQRASARWIVRSIQQQRRLRRRHADHLQPAWPFGFAQSFDNRWRWNVEARDPQLLGDVDGDQRVRDLMPAAQTQSRVVFGA